MATVRQRLTLQIMEEFKSAYPLKSLPTVLLLIILLSGHSTGLECGWAMTPDTKIISYINPSGVEMRNTTTLQQCQSLCVSRSDFLCHSINYNLGNKTCVILAENLQTASQTAMPGWTSAERPACQGVWLLWTATRDMKLSGSYVITEATRDESGTENCTTRCQRYKACRSVTLKIDGGKCELWTKREGDIGVSLQNGSGFQTFNAPLWYQDDSTAIAGTEEDVQNRGKGGTAIQLFRYLTVPVDGYLIGWKYFNAREEEDACISYADIWRTITQGGKVSWQLISQTRLQPEKPTVGTTFQFVSKPVHVKAQDFIGTHIDFSQVNNGGNPTGCDGNQVSFGVNGGQQTPEVLAEKLIELGIQYLTAGQQINTSESYVAWPMRTPSMKAYIFPYASFTSVEILHTRGKIQISWEVEDQLESLPVAGYRLACSNQSNFTSITACPASASHLITSKDVTFTPPTSTQPVYTRVQVIRNINGREEADLTYSQTLIVCSAHPRTEVQINTSYFSRIAAGEETTVSLNINGLRDDDCASQIGFLLSPSSNSSQIITTALVEKARAITAEVDLNTEYNLTLRIKLADNHTIDGRITTHRTPDAPPPPKDFFVGESLRNQTSVRITWSSVYYGLRNVTSYQVYCKEKNGTYNLEAPASPAINMLVFQPINELYITGLHQQVQYTCTMRANIELGYGYNSSTLNFWTKPTDLTATWPESAIEARVEKGTVLIALPSDNTEQAGAKYRYLQIKVETISRRARRTSDSNNIKAELDLYIYTSSNFTVGDGHAYGGYFNGPLSTGVYAISTGYRSETESSVSGFRVVPGGENITIITAVSITPNRDRLTDGVYIAAGIGAVVLFAVIIVIVVVVSKRRNSPRKKNAGKKSLATNTDVIADTSEYVNMPRTVSQPDSRTEMESLTASNDRPATGIPEPVTRTSSVVVTPEKRERRNTHALNPRAETVEILKTAKERGASKHPVATNEEAATPSASSYENVDSRTRVLVNKLAAVIMKERKRAGADQFNQEFQRFSVAEDDRKCVGRRSENKAKNRFKNVTPFDRNRVTLQTSNKFPSDYINASYIQGANGRNKFIASQGPKPGTVIDMWRMIVQEKCKVIIMLTDVIEMGKVKCERYWPEEETSQCIKYGDVTVSLTRKQSYSEFCIWTLQYSVPSDERSMNQGIVDLYHFTTWPDHGTPTTAGLLSFRHRVNEATKLDPSSVPLIHCSAGVGRTGTYIGLDLLISQAEQEGYVDIFNCVEDLRCQRPLMVQTQRQYAFLYDVLAEAVTAGHTSFLCSDLSTKLTQWKSNDGFRVQFEKMNLVAQLQPVMTYDTAKSVQNLSKNTTDILACDKYRVFLRNPINTDYINAVVVNGYYNKVGYICTENPSADTINDYWSMARDEGVKAILHLRSEQERQQFWPESRGESASYGGVTITNKGSSTEPAFNITKYSLTMLNGEDMRKIDLVELLIVSGGVPTVKQLVQLCKVLDRYVQSDDPPLLVQCSDGCRLSGLFSVVMNLYQRTRLEQEVDVVLEVKLARRSRPQFFANQEDFELLYDFLEEYLSEFSEYSNFSGRPATNTQI